MTRGMDHYPAVGALLGLIGAPIKHSAAPAMHEAAARALGLRCYYHLIEVAGLDRAGLAATLDGLRRLGFAGVNVTYPYKEAVVPLLDALGAGVEAIGAVNTVVVRDGRLTGYNTDASGFARAAAEAVGGAFDRPVALIGAGGVGRAAAFALAGLGVPELRLFDRDAAKSETLRAALGGRVTVAACPTVEAALDGAAGVVNGTPVGMLPDRGMAVPANLLHAGLWVADAVYTPLWTPLLEAARAAGARVMTGRALAIYQAVDAFALFTGAEPSAEVMGRAFDEVMARRAAAR